MKPLNNKRIVNVNMGITIFITLVFLILLPLIIGDLYIVHLLIMSCIAIVLGMSFSMQYSAGLVNIGAAAYYAIGAYSSTLLVTKLGFSFWTALPVSIVTTGIISLITGLAFIKAGTFTFVILTLLFNLTLVEALGQVEVLGGWRGFVGIPRPDPIPVLFHSPIEFSGHISCYYLILSILLLIVLAFFALYSSRIGRAWKAINQSSRLAETLGINVYYYRVLAFVVASSASGAVGCFYAHYFGTMEPVTFGGFTSIYIQLYSVLGGLQYYILGPAIGATIMIFGPELLRITSELQPIIFGIILLIIILLFPRGILGTLLHLPCFEIASIFGRIGKIKDLIFSKRNSS